MGSIPHTLSSLLWRVPWRDTLVRALGPNYGLRVVLFHHIADTDTPFTDGLALRCPRERFAERVAFLAEHYDPVSLDTLLDAGRPLPPRPVLVTFDDAYASVPRVAAPVLAEHGVPGLFFVNAAFLDNADLSLDNLLCYVLNTRGMKPIESAARVAGGERLAKAGRPDDLTGVIQGICTRLTRGETQRFKAELLDATGLDAAALARDADLYLSRDELRGLARYGIEVGNHTYSHVFCRGLDESDLADEVGRNQEMLETLTGSPVRSFSVPYGSLADYTPALRACLRETSHGSCFLVHALPNPAELDLECIYRVSMRSAADSETFAELEVLPRLRRLAAWGSRPETRESAS